MPSTSISGSIDHLTTEIGATGNQEQFTNMFRFFNGPLRSGSFVELVALNTGSSAGGTNYHNELTPFGENAWAVWRFVTGSILGSTSSRWYNVYMLMQWADAASPNVAPGAPGLFDGAVGDGVAVAFAWRGDGGNPWNGTSNANGNDTKGNPVWSSGGHSSPLYAIPISNGPGGNTSTSAQNLLVINDSTANPTRFHYFADRDNFLVTVDASDNNDYNRFLHFGTYDPLPGLSGLIPMPIVSLRITTTPWSARSSIGSRTAGATNDGGLCVPITGSYPTRIFRLDRYDSVGGWENTYQPNAQFSPASYDLFRIPILSFDTPLGCVGYISFFEEVYGDLIDDITADGSGTIVGPGGSDYHMVVPWVSGTVALRSTGTRNGRFF